MYLKRYTRRMIQIRQTEQYRKWFEALKDREARFRILVRVRRLSLGNPGDVGSVGDGVFELRIDSGPGYRIYHVRTGENTILLLCGGHKSSQQRDVKHAKQLARSH